MPNPPGADFALGLGTGAVPMQGPLAQLPLPQYPADVPHQPCVQRNQWKSSVRPCSTCYKQVVSRAGLSQFSHPPPAQPLAAHVLT